MEGRTDMDRPARKLKVAHVAFFAPGGNGLYETVREFVMFERRLGWNSNVVDPRPYEARRKVTCARGKCDGCGHEIKFPIKVEEQGARPPAWQGDREVCIAPLEWGLSADVIVSHSGLNEEQWKGCPAPRIHVAHGRPNNSYRIERGGGSDIIRVYSEMHKDPRWKMMVTLWEPYRPYLEMLFPRVEVVPAFVDLGHWRRVETGYDFGGCGALVNVVCADIWREDKDPFWAVFAFREYARAHPEAKLHLYGLDGNGRGRDTLLKCLKDRNMLGEVRKPVRNLRDVYSAATVLMTPHTIATRTVREALACGLSVVAGKGNPFTPYTVDYEDPRGAVGVIEKAVLESQARRQENRQVAEREFSADRSLTRFAELVGEIATCPTRQTVAAA